MNEEILITSYENPDCDGVACAFAYAEFLNKKGFKAVPAFCGIPQKDAQFVLYKFGIDKFFNAEEIFENKKIILVDTSDISSLLPFLNQKNVIEIIDHRKVQETKKFLNAKVQIELVGSCATLIAEKFFNENVEISKDSAVLLYTAIVSNTINFRNKVTTDRDIRMAEWLRKKIDIPKNYIKELFVYRSQIDKSLEEFIRSDIKAFTFNNKKVSIAQLEIVDADQLFSERIEELNQVLDKIKKDNNLDFIFLSCVDVDKGFNRFLVVDKNSEQLLQNILFLNFKNGLARREGILMRKEIWPLVKDYLENIE